MFSSNKPLNNKSTNLNQFKSTLLKC